MESPKQPPRAEAGVVIGSYELVRRLGRGGMADVWVARRMAGASKSVAIKLLADHYVGDERYARMFRAEAELAAILSHANIVQVFDEGEEDGRSYMVMEWVDGINLLKLGAVLALLDDEDRRCRIISYIIGQLLYALGYAHSITSYDGSPLGVVHRDVSPQNVLVSNHGEVKLTDFGVAYHVMEESSGIHVKGKIRYMSPEQIGGKTRLPTVDLFAVGALLHELLEGKKFRGEYDDGQELITAVLSGVVPTMTRPVPPELDELRVRLLAPDPAERIQTAAEAIAWLQRYPGYGDARGELTALCSTFTGIVKPRSGPGQSSQVPMAEQRTTQFKGSKGLAKPRVSSEPAKPAPAPLRVAPTMPSRTGSATAGKSTPAATTPIITGDTEFVRPQRAVGPGKKQTFGAPSGATTAPLPARAQNLAVARAPAAELPSSVPAPAPAAGVAAHPFTSAVPQELVDSQSHSIQVPMHAPDPRASMLPPTERLGRSEVSGTSPGSIATEVIDASMLVEVTSGSGTEREFAPPHLAGEGTDTSREIRSQTLPPSHSISIVVHRRSAIAMLVVGLMLVAATSVTVTWWLFSRDASSTEAKGEEPRVASNAASESPPASTPAEVPAQPTPTSAEAKQPEPRAETPVELAPPPPEPAVEPTPAVIPGGGGEDAAGDEGDAGSNENGSGAEPVDGRKVPGDAGDPTTAGSEPAKAEPTVTDEPTPTAPEEPKKPPSKVAVTVSALPSIASGQVRIGGTSFDIPKGKAVTKKLSPGKKKVEWRTDPKAPWKVEVIELEVGKPLKLQLTFTGPRPAPK